MFALFESFFVRHVMADDATGRGAQLAVSGYMAGHAAGDGALDAALRLRPRHSSKRNCDRTCGCQHPFQVGPPIVIDLEINAIWTSSVPSEHVDRRS